LPLRARGEIVGALDVQSREPAAFSEEDMAVLQTLADQIAVAISNARLFQQAQESLEAERRAYGELSRQAWRELLRGQPALGFLRNKQGLSTAGDLWLPEMETAVRTGQSTLSSEDGAGLAIPVTVGGHVIGVIEARKSDRASEWAADEVALMQTLSDQLGVALEDARLYQDAQRREARERLIGQVTTRMRETLDVQTVLETAANEIYQALGLDKVVLRLAMEEKNDGSSP
jgi:transcriptional regulator with GAF, ATPase, and Fis domain